MKKFFRKSLFSPRAVLALTVALLAGWAVGTPLFQRDHAEVEMVLEEVTVHSGETLVLEEVTIHATGEYR